MTDYDNYLLPVEEKSVYCRLCGDEIFNYEEIENETCSQCGSDEKESWEYYKNKMKVII